MPYKDPAMRRKMSVQCMRRTRMYEAALHAGHPKALEAQRHYRPVMSSQVESRARYLKLRAEVIAEMEAFS